MPAAFENSVISRTLQQKLQAPQAFPGIASMGSMAAADSFLRFFPASPSGASSFGISEVCLAWRRPGHGSAGMPLAQQGFRPVSAGGCAASDAIFGGCCGPSGHVIAFQRCGDLVRLSACPFQRARLSGRTGSGPLMLLMRKKRSSSLRLERISANCQRAHARGFRRQPLTALWPYSRVGRQQ